MARQTPGCMFSARLINVVTFCCDPNTEVVHRIRSNPYEHWCARMDSNRTTSSRTGLVTRPNARSYLVRVVVTCEHPLPIILSRNKWTSSRTDNGGICQKEPVYIYAKAKHLALNGRGVGLLCLGSTRKTGMKIAFLAVGRITR